MRKPILLAGIATLLLFATFFIVKQSPQTRFHASSEQYEKEEGEEEENERFGEQSGADKQLSTWLQAKGWPDPGYLGDKYARAWQQYLKLKQESNNNVNYRGNAANWTSLGPNATIGGRVTCVTVDPTNINNVWAGSASGGIWKSTDASANWSPVITGLPLLGVSALIVHPTNGNIIYAGTGEVYRSGTEGNIGFNVWKARGTYGIGIIKSTNGGTTWSQVLSKSTPDLFGIQSMAFHPTNPDTVFACATDGLYRSNDQGATWTRILTKTYVADIAIDPTNPQRIAVSVGNLTDTDKGVYYTTNASNVSPTWNLATGIPAFLGYITLDNVGSTLYASVGGISGNELYTTANFGQSWTAKLNSAHAGGQYWFAHDLAINPFTTDSILMAGVSWYRYRNSTSTRTNVGTAGHADVHDITFDPVVRGRIYVACDGGVYRSIDGGATFSNRNNGLAATQFYASLAPHPTNANIMLGGLQDNNVVRYSSGTWTQYTGGDGGPCAYSPDGTYMLASHDARNVYYSTNGTAYTQRLDNLGLTHNEDRRTGFMAPLAISKSNPLYAYVASDNLHISTNAGGSFTRNTPASMTRYIEAQYKTAIALAISPTNHNKVYVSTSPFSQNNDNTLNINPPPNVLRSLNASDNTNYSFSSIKGSLPDRFVMDFAISANSDDSVYVAIGGFGTTHVYLTPDGGTTWLPRGTGLPDVPFNAILIDPTKPQVLYAGCDLGVYVSTDRGVTWTDYNNGFWDATLIMDLQVDANNKLLAATHGKGVFRSDLYSGTLPVTISSFNGIHQNGVNKLEWRTESESNLRSYEVERSLNGTDFSRIGVVSPRNQAGINNYSFNDPVNSNVTAIYYYRLKSVELDGGFSYSRTVALQVNGKKNFAVLQNPFGDQLSISANLPVASSVVISLYDKKGSLLRKKSFSGAAGANTFMLDDVSVLPTGTYVVEAIINRQKYSQQVLKK